MKKRAEGWIFGTLGLMKTIATPSRKALLRRYQDRGPEGVAVLGRHLMARTINSNSALRHLQYLDPERTDHIWLLTDDVAGRRPRTLAGPFSRLRNILEPWQSDGYAIHVCVNAMRGEVRMIGEILYIRAVYAEMDHEPSRAFHLSPSFCVRTSPGRFHAYWLTQPKDCLSTTEAEGIQRCLVETFGADRHAKDVARVLRLAGSWHQKGQPFQTSIFDDSGRRYSREELLTAFSPPTPQRPTNSLPPLDHEGYLRAAVKALKSELANAPKGTRNGTLNRVADRFGQLGIDRGHATNILTPLALQIGLTRHETAATIRSGYQAGCATGRASS